MTSPRGPFLPLVTPGFGLGSRGWGLGWGGHLPNPMGLWASAFLYVRQVASGLQPSRMSGRWAPDSLSLRCHPVPQVLGPSMSFPTVMTWCVGTMSSSVATMTRRSGSGIAGNRALSAGGPCGGPGPLKAQLPISPAALAPLQDSWPSVTHVKKPLFPDSYHF